MTSLRSRLRWATLPGLLFAAHCSSTSSTGGDGGTTTPPSDGSPGTDAPNAPVDGGPLSDVSSPDTGMMDAAPVGCMFAPGVDGGPRTYGPNDANLRYYGRADLTIAPNVGFSESASYVTANFMGDSVSITLDRNNGGVVNYFESTIDNYPPVKVRSSAAFASNPQNQHVFNIAPAYDDAGAPVPLACGTHTVTIAKRTEADYGRIDFDGISFAQILPPSAPLPHKIEIIGDSITCGAGVEAQSASDPACNVNFGEGLENGYYAYGPDIARALNADWHVTCASGIGLVRNYYSRGDQRTMPQIYPYLDPEAMSPFDLTLWDTTQWGVEGLDDGGLAATTGAPDAIVIGLGTNDFSRDSAPLSDGGAAYRDPIAVGSLDGGLGSTDGGLTLEQGFVSFIDGLKVLYPHVSVFLVSSPLLGDNFPTQSDLQLTQDQQAIKDVAAYYTGDSSVKVYAVVTPKVYPGAGCGGHPGVAQQAAAAATIAAAMRTALNW
jgi:hypothetical protein